MVSVCPSVLSYHPGRGSRQVGNNCLGESVGHGAESVAPVGFSKGTNGKVGKGSLNYPFVFFLGGISPF